MGGPSGISIGDEIFYQKKKSENKLYFYPKLIKDYPFNGTNAHNDCG